MCNCPSYSAGFVQQSPHMGTTERLGKYRKSWRPRGHVSDLLRVVAVSALEKAESCMRLLLPPLFLCFPLTAPCAGERRQIVLESVTHWSHEEGHTAVGLAHPGGLAIDSHFVAFPPSCLVSQNYPAPVTMSLLPVAVAFSWGRFALHAWGGTLPKAAEVVLLLCGIGNPLRGEHSSGLTLETPPTFWLFGQTLESSWCPQKVTQRRGQGHVPCQDHGLLWGRSLCPLDLQWITKWPDVNVHPLCSPIFNCSHSYPCVHTNHNLMSSSHSSLYVKNL